MTPLPVAAAGDPLAVLDADQPLSDDEASYVAAARAANTLRGYRSDWADWTTGAPGTATPPSRPTR